MTETEIQRDIQTRLVGPDVRLWRNTVGHGWQGIVSRLPDGSVLIRRPRAITFGLAPGSSDLIGLRSVLITPEMVGQRVAVFLAVEVKTERGRATDEQLSFIGMVNALGGRAGLARSLFDAQVLTGRQRCG